MTDKPKGIVDPWRRVEALKPRPRPAPVAADEHQRINIEDVDRDADLAIPGNYTIRTAHASFTITSTRLETPKDALDILAECVADAWLTRPIGEALAAAGIAVRSKTSSFHVPDENTPASMLKGDRGAFWFVQKPLDQGMLVLARILRMPEAAAICRKHGVTVML
jgi:hypothetical protein